MKTKIMAVAIGVLFAWAGMAQEHWGPPRGGERGWAMKPVEPRFWSYVEPEPNSGCWLWSGPLRHNGYARFYMGDRNADTVYMQAHRYSFVLAGGVIPDGLVLDHLCRVRSCVNPRHLEPVTQRENTLRGENHVAVAARRGTCLRGHPYDVVWGGKRACRRCSNATKREWRQTRNAGGS